ncbi:hypothetical protein ACL02U_00980 [Streptomyces sp. MS06]
MVCSTVGSLVLPAYPAPLFVERPTAKAMRRWLNTAQFGLDTPLPRRR